MGRPLFRGSRDAPRPAGIPGQPHRPLPVVMAEHVSVRLARWPAPRTRMPCSDTKTLPKRCWKPV